MAANRVVVVAGPPCSGKGTQCARLAESRGFVHISTGDIFRDEVARGTELGLAAKPYLDSGCFVPDDMVINYVAGRLSDPAARAKGILLDGFPRTADQATALLARVQIDQVILIDVPDKSLIARAAERRIDPSTGKIYHLTHAPPPAGVPVETLVRRDLDDPESFRVRLDTHRAQLRRVLPCFAKVDQVNGMAAPEEVEASIIRILESTRPATPVAPPPVAAAMTCAVCLTEPANFLVTPCGHQCGCEDCLTQVQQSTGRCPICRIQFTAIQRVFRCGGEGDSEPAAPPPLGAPLAAAHADIEDQLDGGAAAPTVDDAWPEEGEVDAPAAGLAVKIAPADDIGPEGGVTHAVVSIETPEGTERAAADVCCVVDISASMRTLATFEDENGKQKNDGLTVLDLVKHSVRTVMHMLGPNDRLSLVSFNEKAATVLPLTPMTDAGRATAIAALESLHPSGRTNIWAGVLSGMETLREPPTAIEGDRASSLLLLTDGMPNVVPPRGHLPELRDYCDQFPDFSFQLNTFGFGYSLDSALLTDLCSEGGGTFAFIPDAVIVGTTFVNACANVLSTFTQNATLSLTVAKGAAFDGDVLGDFPVSEESWGRAISLGPLQLGCVRTVSVPMRIPPGADGSTYLTAHVSYAPLHNGPDGRAEATGTLRRASLDASVATLRGETVSAGRRAVSLALGGKGEAAKKELEVLNTTIASVSHALSMVDGWISQAARGPEGDGRLKALQAEMGGPGGDGRLKALQADVGGRMTKALQGRDRFNRWGMHYLRALIRAHQLQTCTNFMDPGLQVYGGTVFKALRDEGDAIFLKLPPPKPAKAPAPAAVRYSAGAAAGQRRAAARMSSGAAPRAAPAPDMRTYYAGGGGGCFGPSATVTVLDGAYQKTKTSVADVKKGDRVEVAGGTAVVKCVVEIARDPRKPLMTLPSGLTITARHPIRIDGRWTTSAALKSARLSPAPADKVYNFVLDRVHVLLVDGVECITWAHGLSDPAVRHEFYGERVAASLAKMEGWAEGHVKVGGALRDNATDAVVGMWG